MKIGTTLNSEVTNKFLNAVRNNDTRRVVSLLDVYGQKLLFVQDQSWSSSGWTALHFATWFNNIELIKKILALAPETVLLQTNGPWKPLLGFDKLVVIPYRKLLRLNGNQTARHLVKSPEAAALLAAAVQKISQEHKEDSEILEKCSLQKDALDQLPKTVAMLKAEAKTATETKEQNPDHPPPKSMWQNYQEKSQALNKSTSALKQGDLVKSATIAAAHLAGDKALEDKAAKACNDKDLVTDLIDDTIDEISGEPKAKTLTTFFFETASSYMPTAVKEKLNQLGEALPSSVQRFWPG